MARHEDKFHADGAGPLIIDELLALLDDRCAGDNASRRDAIACYLSGGKGWREAREALDGTFANLAAESKGPKAD